MKKFKSILSLFLAVLMLAGCMSTAFAAPAEETEANDTVAQADEIKADEEMSGALVSDADVDWYKLTAAKTGTATLTFAHAKKDSPSSYFSVEVYDSVDEDAEAIASVISAGSSEKDEVKFLVLKDSVYYVKVKKGMVYDGTVGYKVSYAVEEIAASETEPNNAPDQANAMELSLTGNVKNYYGSISGADDVDYFKVKVTQTGALNLYLYNDFDISGKITATLKVYTEGAAGEQELEDVTAITIDGSDDSVIGPTVCVEKGDYLLELKGAAGSYRTRILFRETSYTETEINDSASLADSIELSKTYKATLDKATDVDFFKFTAPATNNGYKVNFTAPGVGDYKITVLNSDNKAVSQTLEFAALTGSLTADVETSSLAAGTYYVKVEAGEELNTGIYKINVVEKEKAEEPEQKPSLIDRIKALDWGILLGNLAGWFEEINIMGMITEIAGSIAYAFTIIGSMFG